MTNPTPKTIFLKDYTPPAYLIETIDLTFDLHEEHCDVTSLMKCKVNPAGQNAGKPFHCYGENLDLTSVTINGDPVSKDNLVIDEESMLIPQVPSKFQLEVITRVYPHKNKALEGLYKSGNIFCTQCEAEGFRRITYFPDKPDILASYSTTILADKDKYPVLLSNGNLVDKGTLENNRHWVKWVDPFKKPSYLFALVAGDLVAIEDTFVTSSKRKVKLQIFVQKENADKCSHAMESLKQAMRWDEQVYGREYDLDIFMIVAVDDFNAGAMENKGLNIFNSSLILAKPDTATDQEYERIQGVVGHEYFHNWTGNRITCRDWFQLSLKEGLTIFRDQDFSADMTSKAVKRISDVNFLRTAQFAEDASPMAHQVRPDAYIEINNFYTVTVYHKGAELIRMMSILLGKTAFFKGMDLYFERHDGQAVTIEDFIKAMEDASSVNLEQFRLWYTQAGTPEIFMNSEYDQDENTYHLTFSQTCPPTPGQPEKKPFHIPIVVSFLSENGKPILPDTEEKIKSFDDSSLTLELTQKSQTFIFKNVTSKPIPSVLRNFSAPVKLRHDLTQSDLLFLMSHDTDAFNRWEAAQQMLTRTILELVAEQQQKQLSVDKLDQLITENIRGIIKAFQITLSDSTIEKAIAHQTLQLPGELYLVDQMDSIDVDTVHIVREGVKNNIAKSLKSDFLKLYHSLHNTDKIGYDPNSAGIRGLKNISLDYLMALGDNKINEICLNQFREAKTMTDEMKALTFLVNEVKSQREAVLEMFYQKWKHDTVVMNTWLMIQAASKLTDITGIEKLMGHSVFEIKNPNKVRALIGTFASTNLINFHKAEGDGYAFLADQIIVLNSINPQMASRLLTPFTRWRKFDPNRQGLIKKQLERIVQLKSVSKDVYEVASKCLV